MQNVRSGSGHGRGQPDFCIKRVYVLADDFADTGTESLRYAIPKMPPVGKNTTAVLYFKSVNDLRLSRAFDSSP